MGAISFQITGVSIVYSTVCSGVDQRKHESFASLALWGEFIDDGEFPSQMGSNAKMIPFDYVMILYACTCTTIYHTCD